MGDRKIGIKIAYRLRHKGSGRFLCMSIRSNEGRDMCNDTTVHLTDYANGVPWEVDSALHAEYVRNFSTPWYNSSTETPKHGFEPEELEVVCLDMVVTEYVVSAKVPTVREYIEQRMAKEPKERAFYEYTLEHADQMSPYSWHELQELLRSKP